MRLGQLSRKLGLKPSDILEFLKTQDQNIESGPNTRLSDEQVLSVVKHFDPSQESSIMKDETSVPEIEQVPAGEQPEPVSSVESEIPADSEGTPEAAESIPEVIRVQKQELPGLKVVGKIELKEPKKKEAEPPPAVEGQEPAPATETQRPVRRQERPARPARRDNPQRTWSNPLEAQRQREAEERKKKREQEVEREKERRTQKYLSKVKSVPTKPVRRQEETVVETHVDARPAPKTWLGKFARWLTT